MNQRMKNSYVLLLAIVLLAISVKPVCGQSINDLEPSSYFNFWIGTWNLSWTTANGQEATGRNHIHTILDGKVLKENFEVLNGPNKGFKGKSMSIYQPSRKMWKQAWVDNSGAYYDFTGSFTDEKRIFQTDPVKLPDGRIFTQRMVFSDIDDDSFIWRWQASVDNGQTWKLNWKIKYQRTD